MSMTKGEIQGTLQEQWAGAIARLAQYIKPPMAVTHNGNIVSVRYERENLVDSDPMSAEIIERLSQGKPVNAVREHIKNSEQVVEAVKQIFGDAVRIRQATHNPKAAVAEFEMVSEDGVRCALDENRIVSWAQNGLSEQALSA